MLCRELVVYHARVFRMKAVEPRMGAHNHLYEGAAAFGKQIWIMENVEGSLFLVWMGGIRWVGKPTHKNGNHEN